MTSINKENWEALRGLTQDRSVVIMNAEKGFYMVLWRRDDNWVKPCIRMSTLKKQFFQILLIRTITRKFYISKFITQIELEYFSYDFTEIPNIGELHLLPKINKQLYNVPGTSVISNHGNPIERASEFLYFHLQPSMQRLFIHSRLEILLTRREKNVKVLEFFSW